MSNQVINENQIDGKVLFKKYFQPNIGNDYKEMFKELNESELDAFVKEYNQRAKDVEKKIIDLVYLLNSHVSTKAVLHFELPLLKHLTSLKDGATSGIYVAPFYERTFYHLNGANTAFISEKPLRITITLEMAEMLNNLGLIYIMLHEAQHFMRFHFTRGLKKDSQIFNLAADTTINHDLHFYKIPNLEKALSNAKKNKLTNQSISNQDGFDMTKIYKENITPVVTVGSITKDAKQGWAKNQPNIAISKDKNNVFLWENVYRLANKDDLTEEQIYKILITEMQKNQLPMPPISGGNNQGQNQSNNNNGNGSGKQDSNTNPQDGQQADNQQQEGKNNTPNKNASQNGGVNQNQQNNGNNPSNDGELQSHNGNQDGQGSSNNHQGQEQQNNSSNGSSSDSQSDDQQQDEKGQGNQNGEPQDGNNHIFNPNDLAKQIEEVRKQSDKFYQDNFSQHGDKVRKEMEKFMQTRPSTQVPVNSDEMERLHKQLTEEGQKMLRDSGYSPNGSLDNEMLVKRNRNIVEKTKLWFLLEKLAKTKSNDGDFVKSPHLTRFSRMTKYESINNDMLDIGNQIKIYKKHKESVLYNILCVVDTSGSVEIDDIKNKFLNEVYGVLSKYNANITLIAADTDVKQGSRVIINKNNFEKFDNQGFTIQGGGGTDMLNPLAYEYANANVDYDVIIVLSDGYYPNFDLGELKSIFEHQLKSMKKHNLPYIINNKDYVKSKRDLIKEIDLGKKIKRVEKTLKNFKKNMPLILLANSQEQIFDKDEVKEKGFLTTKLQEFLI